ncbi:MAG TPA: ABC transporter permease [Burkholderiales bacterium]|nr:ABC transporter permease [Burkholderiales bacterium]
MKSRVATIARFTLLEARRTRVPALVLLTVALLVGASFFVEEITVTEGARFQAGFYAASARFAAVFIGAFYVLASIVREFDDKGLDMILALDLPRSHYVLGKLAGFLGIAAVLSAAMCVPLLWLAPAQAVLQWGISLTFELAIVTALALFCIINFNQLLPAASFVAAFYLLARVLTAMRLMSAHPVAGAGSASHQLISWVVEGLALMMPAFDTWTQTAWLVNQPASWADVAAIVAQGALYVTLLAAAAIFDLYRKNF